MIFTIRYIHETYIITFLFYEIHAHPNTPHRGGMSLLHSHLLYYTEIYTTAMTTDHYTDIYNQIYIHETYIIIFLFYEVHVHPNTPHGGRMTLLHSHFAREKDVIRSLHTIMFN